MFHTKLDSTMGFTLHASNSFFLILLLSVAVNHAKCLNFSYQGSNNSVCSDFEFNGESNLPLGAPPVTTEACGADLINYCGRILHKNPLKLWSIEKGEEDGFCSSTSVLGITPQTKRGSEGLDFMLVKDLYGITPNSYGDQCLGVVNEMANGIPGSNVVQMEFDSKKSYSEDLYDNLIDAYINSSSAYINSSEDMLAIYWSAYSEGIAFCLFVGDFAINNTYNTSVPVSYYVSGDTSTPIWVWVVLSITGTIMIYMTVINIYWLIKKATKQDQEREGREQEGENIDQDQEGESSLEHQIEISMIGPKKYQLNELKSATNNFNAQNEIGRGGFGIVYKGTLRGEVVAVKRVSRNDQQGRKNMIAEISTIGNLHHKNLVKLYGWCHESNELLLVYEYMPNGSLDNLLFPQHLQSQTTLCWERRYNIVCGVAHSIDYLHNECSRRVLHRDIKTSNIMLDSDFNACLGDFGLARMFKLSENTHHTTQEIAGTRAYMAPEIFFTGKATTQTDIYAFGVLVLEVACGKRPLIRTENRELGYSIVDWVWEFYKLGMICSVVDPKLNESYDKDEAECALLIGLSCCHPDPQMRPSVRSALRVLMGETLPPSVPLEKPGFMWPCSAPPLSVELDDQLVSGGILSSLSLYER